ncbi:MAG: transcription antitermination factor NusB, partial [Armatimonadota bacterium]
MKVRRLGREIALAALYQVDLLRVPLESALADAGHLMPKLRLDGEDADPGPVVRPRDDAEKFLDQLREAREFARDLCQAALERREELDEIIERYAEGWSLSR